LIKALLERDDKVCLSVSHTTRTARPGEIAGQHYHFVDEQTFLELISQNAFLEHARVFDRCYGTGLEAGEDKLAAGYDVILDIDWQGARQIRASFPACRSIFILPPSLETLRKRLAGRGQDSEDVIRRRMKDARAEISHCNEFDFMIVNDDFDLALADLQSIVRQGRPLRQEHQNQLTGLVAELLKNG